MIGNQSAEKSALLFYFTGTGNTQIIAEKIKNNFEIKGIRTEIIAIENILNNPDGIKVISKENFNTKTIFGFGYPIHAFNAPKILFEFIELLNRSDKFKGKRCFIFKNSGDPFMKGGSTHLVRKALTNAGFDVTYERLFVMPANVFIKFDDSLIKQLIMLSNETAASLVDDILLGQKRLQKNSWFNRVSTKIFSFMESKWMKYFGNMIKITEDCNLCGVCMNSCPTKNIEIKDDNIIYSNQCVFCMRCINNCPQQAIKMKYMKFLTLKDVSYNRRLINKIIRNPEIQPDYLNENTKGFFKRYYRFFNKDLKIKI